ncbi:MAG TPA: hypothetical protein VLI05_02440 [Candidatus Saccharimonadia bacterium]|nr:hypothetical protein [Candidatus Saccharimonadia bacterium]
MTFTWKDAITTVFAVAVAALTYAKYTGWSSWLTAPRLGILTLGAVGLAMCILGAPAPGYTPWNLALGALGAIAIAFVVSGLILGSSWLFFALAGDLVALWLLTTVKHVFRLA